MIVSGIKVYWKILKVCDEVSKAKNTCVYNFINSFFHVKIEKKYTSIFLK